MPLNDMASSDGTPSLDSLDLETSPLSVLDVYDLAGAIGLELEKLIEQWGADSVRGLMGKVISALEQLEKLASRNQKDDQVIGELRQEVSLMQREKKEKAVDRKRFEEELEQLDDHYKEESHELLKMISKLQEENKKLSGSLREKEAGFVFAETVIKPDEDLQIIEKLRLSNDKTREALKLKDKELQVKTTELDSLRMQVERFTETNKDMKKKQRQLSQHIHKLIEERAELQSQLQDQSHDLHALRQKTGEKAPEPAETKPEADQPRFTVRELKGILIERNELKARVNELEDELALYRPDPKQSVNLAEEGDAPVQGPLPEDPMDAPWRKTDSGIRRFFRKLLHHVSFNDNQPKRGTMAFSASSGTLSSY